MRVLTVLGTRPEIIRLSLIIPLLDRYADHVVVNTAQNFEPTLNDLFFLQLRLRAPDVRLSLDASGFGAQVGSLFAQMEMLLREHHPDRVLILGDTNSGLSALMAKRLGVPVYHMEAGNRCFDDRVPEEINRRVIDHCSSVLLPYTHRSKENLTAEGIARDRIFVVGNPIGEVLEHYKREIDRSGIIDDLGVAPRRYLLATLHRAENVDNERRLRMLFEGIEAAAVEHAVPVVCSLHPRTRSKLEAFGLNPSGIRFIDPVGFFDFVRLERDALCVLSDSGTVQEECCILHVPSVTLREVTERPETIEAGSNAITGATKDQIVTLVRLAIEQPTSWLVPAEYQRQDVARTVVGILLSHRPPPAGEEQWLRPG